MEGMPNPDGEVPLPVHNEAECSGPIGPKAGPSVGGWRWKLDRFFNSLAFDSRVDGVGGNTSEGLNAAMGQRISTLSITESLFALGRARPGESTTRTLSADEKEGPNFRQYLSLRE
jgi:hypothetical protein